MANPSLQPNSLHKPSIVTDGSALLPDGGVVVVAMATKMESRVSMLDVVKNGLISSGRATFLHRQLFIGEHKLGKNVEDFIQSSVTPQSEQSREEGLTGFLLAYHNHYIHLVEGPQSALTRHLRYIVKANGQDSPPIGVVKVLIEIPHTNKRCMSSWISRAANPPTLASLLQSGMTVAETAQLMDAVFSKMMRLVDGLGKLPAGATLTQQMILQLPEPQVLQSLLASPLIPDIRSVVQEQRLPVLPSLELYDDVVWPMQSDFVPYNLLVGPNEEDWTGKDEQQPGGEDDDEEEEEAGERDADEERKPLGIEDPADQEGQPEDEQEFFGRDLE